MKKPNYFLLPLGGLLALTSLLSCGEDRWPEYYPFTGRDLWIDSVLREEYLWAEEMPSSQKLNYFLNPKKFLDMARSEKDKGFSKVDSFYTSPLPSYGFSYSLNRVPNNDTAYYALVTEVMPQSPASEAGLQRGEWIMKVDHEFITKKHEKVLKEGDSKLLTIGKYSVRTEPQASGSDKTVAEVVENRSVNLPATRAVEVTGIPVATILQNGKTAYLLCNRLHEKEETTLCQFSKQCKEAGVTELVIDLRNHVEGKLETAQLLATMIVPQSKLGSTFATLVYSAKNSARNRELKLEAELLKEGVNLNLNRVFVLTSQETAGPAEMLINGLSPHMKVIQIGETTRGEYVATTPFIHPTFLWQVSPAVCYVYNANHEGEFAEGLAPLKSINALSDPSQVLPYGNPQEALLKVALGMIDGSIEIPQEQPEP